MLTANKKPKAYSAATTASVISRKLRKAGFPMTTQDERGRWSTGYSVARVGYGSSVGIHYRIAGEHHYHPSHREIRREAEARAREWAVAEGYTLDDHFTGGCYIKCEVE
jgi:hypothetical protein